MSYDLLIFDVQLILMGVLFYMHTWMHIYADLAKQVGIARVCMKGFLKRKQLLHSFGASPQCRFESDHMQAKRRRKPAFT
jgi:hypothetical protein